MVLASNEVQNHWSGHTVIVGASVSASSQLLLLLLLLLSSVWRNASECAPNEWLTADKNCSRMYKQHSQIVKNTTWWVCLITCRTCSSVVEYFDRHGSNNYFVHFHSRFFQRSKIFHVICGNLKGFIYISTPFWTVRLFDIIRQIRYESRSRVCECRELLQVNHYCTTDRNRNI